MWKRLWKTKSLWLGLSSIASGIALVATGEYIEGAQMICGGLGLIFLRNGVAKIADVVTGTPSRR